MVDLAEKMAGQGIAKETPSDEQSKTGEETIALEAQTAEEPSSEAPEKQSLYKEEPEIEPEEDHRIRSEIGRKLTPLERRIEALYARMDQLVEKVDRLPHVSEEHKASAEDDEMPLVLTGRELEQRLDRYMSQRSNRDASYWKGIEDGLVEQMASANDPMELSDMIAMELKNLKDIRKTGNPKIDAEMAYLRAKNNVITQRAKTKKPMLKSVEGGKPQGPLGAGHKGVMDTPPKPAAPKLDPEAAALAKRLGFDDDKINKILGRS